MMRTFEHSSSKKLCRLWLHEVGRVFGDRLINEEDQELLFRRTFVSLSSKAKEDLGSALREYGSLSQTDENGEPIEITTTAQTMMSVIKFSDLLDPMNTQADMREYDEVK